MLGTWNPATYRERAKKWREEAETLPPGKERDACMVLAEGYANLAAEIRGALTTYAEEVRSGAYPAPEHTYAMPEDELEVFSADGVEQRQRDG